VRCPSPTLLLCAAAILAVATANFIVPPAPVLAGSDARERGSELFATRGCVFCHGPAGVGGGRGPDLQLVRKRLTADQMTHQIHDGGKGMPPFGEVLTTPEISDLVTYLRAKRKFIKVPPPPEAPKPDPSN
jgi:mono/diheme cytochrome c family protein